MELLTRSQLFSLLMTAITTYISQNADPESRPVDVTPGDLRSSYDFIIIGAGAAGSVLGSRLSENGNWTVLILEAGGSEYLATDVPILGLYSDFEVESNRWNYVSTPQEHGCLASNKTCNYFMGKMMGGSTSVGPTLYSRGNRANYITWAEQTGSSQWAPENVYEYYYKMENASSTNLSPKYHGQSGPQSVQLPHFSTPVNRVYIEAGRELGLNVTDYNAESQIGVAEAQLMMRGGIRASAATSYLKPVTSRNNLDIAEHSLVTKLTFDETNRTATGVYFKRNGTTYHVRASKEVILSAGTLNSPALLMLSGIGHREHLESLDIPVIADLPVGDNLHDHVAVISSFSVNESIVLTDSEIFVNRSVVDFAEYGNGSLTTTTIENVVFVNVTDVEDPRPNIILTLLNYRPNADLTPDPSAPYVLACLMDLLSPRSRGTVRLRSNNPEDPPIINPNLLAEEVDFNIAYLGMTKFLDLMNTTTMRRYSPKVYFGTEPNCAPYADHEEDYITCIIRQYSFPDLHPVGTCRMGRPNEATSVVDPNLLVLGFTNLRVIDASTMPVITSGNTGAPTMMIAEQGSDIIKSTWESNLS